MTNNLNEKRSYAVIIAAVVSAMIVMVCGLATGLVYAVRERRQAPPDDSRLIAGYLLTDAAYSLRNSMSALRLCNEPEPAEEINRTALVHAVRAETALECHDDDWAGNRSKEQFLNCVATVLHSYTPEQTIELSEKLYEYSAKFYVSVIGGAEFEYNGELIESNGVQEDEEQVEVTQAQKDEAQKIVQAALDPERSEFVGAWGEHMEFYIERDGKTGYALVCNNKIIEYSFMREDDAEHTDVDEAERLALEAAKACGFDHLTVKWSVDLGKSVGVIMCKSYGGALATDDCANAVVSGGEVVAFSAGKCETEHKDIPSVKKTEREARRATKDGDKGTLVVRNINGKERICYEYRYDLEDGVHYVYVCAENGKQIQVK